MTQPSKNNVIDAGGETDKNSGTGGPFELTRRAFLQAASEVSLLLGGGLVPIFCRGEAGAAFIPVETSSFDIQTGFINPPDASKPYAYWLWLNGNISREGVTADLEAMKAAGLGGAWLQTDESAARGPIRFMTAEWQELFRHTVAEAKRLDLRINMATNDGYDCGGPWVTPDHAMQKMVWTETHVLGPQKFSAVLPQPPATLDYYRDIAVIACRTSADGKNWGHEVMPKIALSLDDPAFILHEYAIPLTARAITVVAWPPIDGSPSTVQWELQVSDDGQNFRTVIHFDLGGYVPKTLPIEAVRARYFRLLAPSAMDLRDPPDALPTTRHGYDRAGFRLFSETRMSLWEQKAGFINAPSIDRQELPTHRVDGILRRDILDLTSLMDQSGRLDWQVPEGGWTLFRIGHTPTGKMVGSATQEGMGLVVDTLSRKGVETNFPAMMGKLLNDSRSLVGHSLRSFHLDSWEAEAQNWTAGFREEFRRRRGYDMTPYLPVMAGGRIVQSYDISERFLWDVRRTIADLIAEKYWGRLTELCHEQGVQFTAQASNSYTQFMCDPLLFQSKSDLPMCEFWITEHPEELWPECKLVPSAAHIYGKVVVAAEAFTAITSDEADGGYAGAGQWREHPFLLKRLGDRAYCRGINCFFLSHYAHQPDLNARPGMLMVGQSNDRSEAGQNVTPKGWITGTNFDRTQTWWGPGSAWTRYLARCQYLLQAGTYVADLCLLMDEGAPSVLVRPETLPPGYEFDCINLDSLSKASAADGRILLPSGMSYRLLVLPASRQMTPELLRCLKELITAGATVVGPMPIASPSLSNYPSCDEEVTRIADELWSQEKVLQKSISEVLEKLSLKPDFEFAGATKDAELQFIHRRTADAQIYFISNQKERFEELECTFRVNGRIPELWDPDSGRMVASAVYEQRDGRTKLPLRFDPYGSVFVLFRKPAGDGVVSMMRDSIPFPLYLNGLGDQFQGAEIIAVDDDSLMFITARRGLFVLRSFSGKEVSVQVPSMPVVNITGPWQVLFPPNWGAPDKITLDKLISWTKHSNDGVKYFSGTATYITEFEGSAEALRKDRESYLDLGKVAVMAEIILNGKSLGVQWKPPFRVAISDAMRFGKNRLEVKVTNLWPNRLIGDQNVSERQRVTRTNFDPYTRNSTLLESGLLGPVQVQMASKVSLRLS